jgi:hypothetical protein
MIDTKILTRVRNLLRLAGNNASVEESALAAAAAQRLIDEHNLSAALLAADTNTPDPDDAPLLDTRAAGADPIEPGKPQRDGTTYQDRWKVTLASTIAKANGSRIYTWNAAIQIIGRPADIDTVRYLYSYLRAETERLTELQGRGMGATWRNNFKYGVVDAIRAKLAEGKKQFEQEARTRACAQAASSGTALIKVDRALATIEKRGTDIERYMYSPEAKATGLKLSKVKTKIRVNNSARAAGRAAGSRIQIGNAKAGLGAGSPVKGYLK